MTSDYEKLLDKTGWRILRELQRNARLPMSELAKRVKLSAPAVAERVRRMEDAGIIAGYRAVVDPSKLGRPITAFVHLEESARTDDRVISLVESLPEVVECHTVTGGEGFIMKVVVRSVAHLDSVIARLVPYGRPRTSLVLSSPIASRAHEPPKP